VLDALVGLVLALVGIGMVVFGIVAWKIYAMQRRKQKEFLRNAIKTKGEIIEVKQVKLDVPLKVHGINNTYCLVDEVLCPVYVYTDQQGNQRILDTEKEQIGLYNQFQFFVPKSNWIPLKVGDRKTIYYRPDTGEQFVDYNMVHAKLLIESGVAGFLLFLGMVFMIWFAVMGISLMIDAFA
jgi:hypothetical protein